MNKMKKVIAFAACATMVATLSGCTSSSAKYTKVGFGMVTTISQEKVNTTMATVGLDSKGKVQYLDIDCAQQDTNATGDALRTKYEKKTDYGMKGDSPIGKEWNEQIDEFTKWATGKTADEIAGVETMDFHGGKAAKTGTDLAAGCTITIDDILSSYAEAFENAK